MNEIPVFFHRGDGWWVPEDRRFPSNKSSALKATPEIIVIHWTGGTSGSIEARTKRIKEWSESQTEKASVHFEIMRDGTIYQIVPTTRAAWHAGESKWRTASGKTRNSVNFYSIGVEIDNVGPVTKKGDDWVDSFGRPFSGPIASINGKQYEMPTADQFIALRLVIDSLRSEFKVALKDIVGHLDVSPGRKIDPGPLVTRRTLGYEDGR